MQALDTQDQSLILDEQKVQGVERGAVVLCLPVSATTTVGEAGPSGERGSGLMAVGTGLG